MSIPSIGFTYKEAIGACRRGGSAPPEARPQTEGLLGGPRSGAALAPAPPSGHRQAVGKAHLELAERIELEAALRAGDTQAVIAARLGRSAGTISQELARHGGRAGYRAAVAHRAALARSRRIPRCATKSMPGFVAAGRRRKSPVVSRRTIRSWPPCTPPTNRSTATFTSSRAAS